MIKWFEHYLCDNMKLLYLLNDAFWQSWWWRRLINHISISVDIGYESCRTYVRSKITRKSTRNRREMDRTLFKKGTIDKLIITLHKLLDIEWYERCKTFHIYLSVDTVISNFSRSQKVYWNNWILFIKFAMFDQKNYKIWKLKKTRESKNSFSCEKKENIFLS